MKRLILFLTVLLAFACSALAQDAATSSSGQTSTTTTKKTHKSKSASSDSSMASDSMKTSSGKSASGKTSQLTGCISSSADTNGDYTLTNGRYKKGVELVSSGGEDVSKHAGHEVKLTGTWASSAEKSKNGEKQFQVASIKHMSDTCPASAKAGSKGNGDMAATTTKGKNKKAGNAMVGSTSTPK